jgi:uncharacterized OB-fold protein
MSELVPKPVPVPSAVALPYWEGLQRGEFCVQRCAACGTLRHYPRLLCRECFSDAVDWQAISGEGHIHSYTVAHYAYHPGFAAELPYTLVTIELTVGLRALGRWLGAEVPQIGAPVRMVLVPGKPYPTLSFAPA